MKLDLTPKYLFQLGKRAEKCRERKEKDRERPKGVGKGRKKAGIHKNPAFFAFSSVLSFYLRKKGKKD